ncbi:MAG: LytR C-terminal domain-containing protein [Nocardioides sp.]
MTRRHLTTAVTLAVLMVILVIAAVVGFNALFAPLPGSDEPTAAAPSPSCTASPVKGRLRTKDVAVNVFNAGTRAGLAGSTFDALRARGFKGGEIGNAPSAKVRRAQVWIVEGEEDAGKLVARQLVKKAKPHLVSADEDHADGVYLVVGNGFRKLVRGAPRSVKVTQSSDDSC